MRELKFRLYDGNNKYFIYPDILELNAGLEYEQFTGLLDRNGKEIYEGDIVSRFYDTQRAVVTFKGGCFVSLIQKAGGSKPQEDILSNDLAVTEVIGNIWQSPELISKSAS